MPVRSGRPGFLADPYPAFAALRALGPVHDHPLLGHARRGVARGVLGAAARPRPGPDLGRRRAGRRASRAFNLLHRNSLLEREGRPHARLRALVAGAFNRGHTARLEPWVRALAGRLVDELGRADPGRRVGRPDRRAGRAAAGGGDRGAARACRSRPAPRCAAGRTRSSRCTSRTPATAPAGGGRAGRRRVRRRAARAGRAPPRAPRRRPGQRPAGRGPRRRRAGRHRRAAADGRARGDRQRDRQRGAGPAAPPRPVAAAAGRPRAGPRRPSRSCIRYDPPLQLFERTAVVDTAVAGHPVPAGTQDRRAARRRGPRPAVFDRPDELDVGRHAATRTWASAPGVHYCLGAPLARLEVAATLDALRTPAAGPARWPPSRRAGPDFVMRGLRELRGACGSPVTAARLTLHSLDGEQRSRARRADRAEQPGQPGDQHRGDAGGAGGEQVQHRVQHHAVGARLHAGAQRPDQHDGREHAARRPTAPTTRSSSRDGRGRRCAVGPARACSISASTEPGTARFSPGTSQPSTTRARERDGRTPAASAAAARGPQRPQHQQSPPATGRAGRRDRARARHQRVGRGDRAGGQRPVPAGQQQHVAPRPRRRAASSATAAVAHSSGTSDGGQRAGGRSRRDRAARGRGRRPRPGREPPAREARGSAAVRRSGAAAAPARRRRSTAAARPPTAARPGSGRSAGRTARRRGARRVPAARARQSRSADGRHGAR